MDIVVVGFNMVDFILYIYCMLLDGEIVEVFEFWMGCGGKGVN